MMRWTIAPVLAVAFFFSPAQAADPIGTWVPEPEAVERNADRYAEAMAAQVTPEALAQLRQQVEELEQQLPMIQQQDPAFAERLAENVARARDMADGLAEDPRGYYADRMKRVMGDGELRIMPEGAAAWLRAENGGVEHAPGEWSLDGSTIEVTQQSAENPADATRFTGSLDENRMELKMILSSEQEQRMAGNPEMLAAMRDTTYILLRK